MRKIEIRDGRYTVILLTGCIFILWLCFSTMTITAKSVAQNNRYALQIISNEEIRLVKDKGRVESIPMPVNFSPFFFAKIDINKADQDLLMTIRGIGPKLASKIVQTRLVGGDFKRVADLQKIKGIGTKRVKYFAKIFDFDGER